jgi:hypothetical protein
MRQQIKTIKIGINAYLPSLSPYIQKGLNTSIQMQR